MLAELQLLIVEVAVGEGRGVSGTAPGTAAPALLLTALTHVLRGLRDPALAALAGPPVPGATLPLGARVPGTSFELDPASAAASLGALMYVGAPSAVDAVAPALAIADYAARHAPYDGCEPPRVADLFAALDHAAALQAALAQDPRCAADPWFAPRVAGALAAALLLGADEPRRRAAALGAALDGSPPAPATLQAACGAAPDAGAALLLRRAAGENAARSIRHALAACDGTARGACVRAAETATTGADAGDFVASHSGQAATAGDFVTGDSSHAGRKSAGNGAAARFELESLQAIAADFTAAVLAAFPQRQAQALLALFDDPARLTDLGVDACIAQLVRN
ncbi:MAG: hypothetical protein IT481_15055 [Gammaproteobacteria bacterium]|nr:hypothetical protein [Gammaproteobacteria bacterium]